MKDTNKNSTYSSHDYFAPLNLVEQKKILEGGACIHCHQKEPSFLKRLTTNYIKMLESRKTSCIIP